MSGGEYAQGDTVADKYRIERILGQGGMGTVYLAMHTELDEPVALKVLIPAVAKNPEAVSRFLREAKASVRIKGDHVARVLDAGRMGDTPFMVMEYLEGRDLGALLETDGPVSIEMAIEFILQAADAVAQAHALGIVHRDLKPQNLFLTKRPDGSPLIKVLDFGISKAEILGNATFGTTNDGTILGSPAYMSPEQIRSAKNVAPSADLWSLGIILYELISGASPFDADTLHGLLLAISISEPVPITTHRADVPAYVIDALERCLSKVPEQRPANVGELALLLSASGTPSQKQYADRVVATLRMAAERGSSSQRIPVAPAPTTDTLALASLPLNAATSEAGLPNVSTPVPVSAVGATVALDAARQTAPMDPEIPAHPLARVQSGLARLSPRAFGGVIASIVLGVVLAVMLTRTTTTPDLGTIKTKATLASPLPSTLASGEVAPIDTSMPPLAPTTSASATGSAPAPSPLLPATANKGAKAPAAGGKSDGTPAPIRKIERAGKGVGRFLDCKIGGNCK